ncbi:hypothetical protein [Hydrogenophaga sp.]|uniref:hypothetical protein n=1 Tax=Hydrogenophaga sp. TaxID=1904254 RepID=UPI0025C0E44A|nr:hypothetical protein [Hydrogenophaga sp.]
MKKTIKPGQMIPAWYGIAWQNFDSRTAVCYPVPINVIVATGRAFWLWLRYGYKPVPIDPRDAFVQGVSEGYHSGLLEGKKAKCKGEPE